MKINPDVTAVVNLHKEGIFAKRALESVCTSLSCAKLAGISSEIIVVMDLPDSRTIEIVAPYKDRARIQVVDFGSLSESRNYAVREAQGDYIGFIDGDDLWGSSWIKSAFQLAQSLDKHRYVIHPKMNVYFGRGVSPHCFVHPDMRYEKVDLFDIIAANKWTALSFAAKEIYQAYRFQPIDLQSGFGYEDWAWNFETVRNGVLHITVEDGIHFIRTKKGGSMLVEAQLHSAIPLLLPTKY